jgi:predicted nucleotidyltransferase
MFSKTEMILLVFISKTDEQMYERQIALGAKVSVGSTNSILNRFAKLGLVSKTVKGKMSFYSANFSNPLLRQFKIFCTINSLMPLLSKVSNLSQRIILFGSCANGTDNSNSDVDLFIHSSNIESIKRILDSYPKVQALILNSNEWINLSKKDEPLYNRINAGLVLWEAD